jgi:hypothetical protein
MAIDWGYAGQDWPDCRSTSVQQGSTRHIFERRNDPSRRHSVFGRPQSLCGCRTVVVVQLFAPRWGCWRQPDVCHGRPPMCWLTLAVANLRLSRQITQVCAPIPAMAHALRKYLRTGMGTGWVEPELASTGALLDCRAAAVGDRLVWAAWRMTPIHSVARLALGLRGRAEP